METSQAINELAAALAHAQGEMENAVRDSSNPFFKSKYADLASVREACRVPFAKHGLSVVQSPSSDGSCVSVETLLLHVSGQWIRGTASARAKDDQPQSIGSAITYLRRYALQSFAGVAPEDDDGEAATSRNGNGQPATDGVIPYSAPAPPAALPSHRGERENPAAVTGEATATSRQLGVLIVKVDRSTISKTNSKPKWFVHFDTGTKASTIDHKVAAQAERCNAAHIRVQPELQATEKWGYNLVQLFEVSSGLPEIQLRGDEHTEPLTDADIPF